MNTLHIMLVAAMMLSFLGSSRQSAIKPATPIVSFHPVYVLYYDVSIRHLNEGQALKIYATKLHEEVSSIVNFYNGDHEIIAHLTAAATKNARMYTGLPNSDVEVETFIFLFSDQDARLLPFVQLLGLPDSEEKATPQLPQKSNPAQRRKNRISDSETTYITE